MKHWIVQKIAAAGLIILCSVQLFAQTCASVDAGPDASIPCGVNCTTLHAKSFPSGSTTSYGVSQITYAPQSFTGGTKILVDTDDYFSGIIKLPFNFCYFGNTYNNFIVGVNGVLSFDTTRAYNACPFSVAYTVPGGNTDAGLYNSILAPWQDMDPTFRGSISYQVLGTAPCRMLIVSWDSIPMFGDPNSTVFTRDPSQAPYTPHQYFESEQVVIYETTNVIDINILQKDTVTGWNGGRATEGIVNSDATVAFTVPGRNDSAFTAQNDAWRFTPNGTPNGYTISWYEGSTFLGTGDSITVCPNESLQTTYTAIDSIIPCGGGTPVVVTDDVTVTLTGSTLLAGIDSSKNISCAGGSNGFAWAHSSGGVIPVSYNWYLLGNNSSLGSTKSFGATSPGTYVFLAIDNNGCQRSDTVTVTEPTPLTLQTSQTQTSCSGSTGSATVIPFGGTPPYTYAWSAGNATGQVDTALAAGDVTVTVTDANGCSVTNLYTITKAIAVTARPLPTDARCHGSDDGSIDANPSGGTPPYSYNWSDGQLKEIAVNLSPGNYIVTVSDVNGCSAVADTTITEPDTLKMDPSGNAVKCKDEPIPTGSIVVHPPTTGGTPPYHFAATADYGIWYSDSAGVINGLPAGDYTLLLSDANGCTQTADVIVPDAIPDSFSVAVYPTLCFGDSNGAVLITDNTPLNEQYSYSIDSTNQSQASGNFHNLVTGNHTVTAINAHGCVSTIPFSVSQPAPLTIALAPDTFTLTLGESKQVQATSSSLGNTTYTWSPDFGLSCSDCSDPMVNGYTSQDYTVTANTVVVDTVNNQTATCQATTELHVRVGPHQRTFIPNSFTPNGDGINDFFLMYGEALKVVDMQVFDRWGELMFETHNMLQGWDGTYKGVLQMPGVFTYAATITYLDDTQVQMQGSITLLR